MAPILCLTQLQEQSCGGLYCTVNANIFQNCFKTQNKQPEHW